MVGKGKKDANPGTSTSGGVKKRRPIRLSERAGLKFPVRRIHNFLKAGSCAKRVGMPSAVHAAGVLEHLVGEILELAAKAAVDNKKSRITPRCLMLAIRKDRDLDQMLSKVTIGGSGVVPYIYVQLLPKRTLNETRNRPTLNETRNRPTLNETRNRPTLNETRNRPTLNETRNRPALNETRNRPALNETRNRPTLNETRNRPALNETRNRPALNETRNRPALNETRNRPALNETKNRPALNKTRNQPGPSRGAGPSQG